MAENYRKVLGTVNGIKRGFTTGTTAAAAAKAATYCLLSGVPTDSISVKLPKSSKPFSNKEITIPVNSCRLNRNKHFITATASVLKDSGDNKDDTDGIEIFAEVKFITTPGISLAAGEGIGTITRDGLPVKPGNPAINPVPQKMIKSELRPLLNEAKTNRELPAGINGLNVTLTAPRGRLIAAGTWNNRIGVEGGISIIGTSGVVEPHSESAFKTSVGLVIKTAAQERENFTIISGYVGERFLTAASADEQGQIAVGDLIGFALEQCLRRGIKQIFLPLHIGKLTKIAAGLFNTHCKFGDARLETLAAAAAACGATQQQTKQLLEIQLAEEASALLRKWKLEHAFSFVAERAKWRCEKYLEKSAAEHRTTAINRQNITSEPIGDIDIALSVPEIPKIETAALDLEGNLLGWSGNYKTAEDLCKNFM